MEPSDYDRLDPERRTHQYFAIGSAALGIISLCPGALLPICGILFSLLGVVLGYISRKSEYRNIALAGMALSFIGFLTAIVYGFLMTFYKP